MKTRIKGNSDWKQFLGMYSPASKKRPTPKALLNDEVANSIRRSDIQGLFAKSKYWPELGSILMEALAQLSPYQSTILKALFWWEGGNVTELAEQLNTSPHAIRKTKSRAIRKLSAVLLRYAESQM